MDFEDFAEATVELNPPGAANVVLRGELTGGDGVTRPALWKVRMHFNSESLDWTGGLTAEVAAVAP